MKTSSAPRKKRNLSTESSAAVAKQSSLDFLTNFEREELRWRRTLVDSVTDLPTLPALADDFDLLFDKHSPVGVVYFQVGKSSGLENMYGWEFFDEILRTAALTLSDWAKTGGWKDRILSIHFNNMDGFYLLVGLSGLQSETPHLILELLGHQVRDLLHARLVERFDRNLIDLLGVFHSVTTLEPDPQVRISRHLHRALDDVSRAVQRAERREQTVLEKEFRDILKKRRIHTVFQPIFHLPNHQRVGYEALSRGPEGSLFESPDNLFAAARASQLLMELESICQASAFESLRALKPPGRIFVNTSSNFISHPVFQKRLKDQALKKIASNLVLEITEKEAIQNYNDFRKDIEPVRKAGIRIAVDDAGSGYADLESIAEVKPEYIKIANSITRNVGQDLIKQEIVSSFLGLARKLRSTIIAEGIETREDYHVLQRLGVEFGQGFFLGRPAQLVAAN